MVDWTMALKDVNVLIPRTCEYVIFHGKRNVVDVMKLGVWDGEIILCTYKGRYKTEGGRSESVVWDTAVIAGRSSGVRKEATRIRNADGLWKLWEERKQILTREPPERTSLAGPVTVIFRLRTSRTGRWQICVVLSPYIWGHL